MCNCGIENFQYEKKYFMRLEMEFFQELQNLYCDVIMERKHISVFHIHVQLYMRVYITYILNTASMYVLKVTLFF